MRTFALSLGAALLLAATSSATAASQTLDKATIEKLKGNPTAFAAPKMRQTGLLSTNGLQNCSIAPKSVTNEGTSIGPTSYWGTLKGPDGNEWLYTQEVTVVEGTYGDVDSSTITVYNADNQQVGQFSIDIPENEKVNDMQVFGYVTNNFFDSNSSTYEITVYIQKIDESYNSTSQINVYNVADGTLIASYEGDSALYASHTANWSTYQRYMIARNEIVDGVNSIVIDIYSPVSWQSEVPVVEHSFTFPFENVQYSDGAYFNTYFINDEPYFVTSYYEKPYMQYGDDWSMTLTPDNNYLITVYNKDYEEVASLSIPVAEGMGESLYTMYTFGYFSYDDLNLGEYSGDDKLNLIVTRYDYITSSDSYLYNFDVYDQDGNLVDIIGEGITTWLSLSDIEGQPKQVAFVRTSGSSESIEMVNLPSCESVATFPGILNGDLLSTNLDRYPVNDTYQYVIGLGSGYDDGNGNTITRVGWYNIDTTLDHFVDINLGPNAIYAKHQFVTGSLDPYLFNTDDMHEYILMANIQDADGSAETELCIANDKGEIIRRFNTDAGKGAYNFGYLSNANANGKVSLIVAYVNDDDQFSLEFYPLPFSMFDGGGSGTAEDPYIISTPGDLDQVRNMPNACYKLGNDIDMSKFYGSFDPIADFNGSLDGCGYSIDNLTINADQMDSGLFQGIYDSNGSIKNLTFNNPVVAISPDCSEAGVLAGSISSASAGFVIENVHVNNASFTTVNGGPEFGAAVGGLVGMLTSYSKIIGCSVNNVSIDVPTGYSVGGIVGSMRTSASVSASTASGTIVADTEIGGIVGNGGTGYTVTNCYADIDITGSNTIGGIVGLSDRSTANGDDYISAISNCYATGNITATEGDWSGYFNVGGIAGSINPNWSEPELADSTICNSLAAIESINIPEGAEALAVGRIAGYTVAIDMEGSVDGGLVGNYAIEGMTIGGETVASSDATSVNGADVDAEALNTEFFTETLKFKFGTTADSPWKATSSLPILYFEQRATGITLDVNETEAMESSLTTVTATVEGTTADRVVFTSSDSDIAEVIAISIDGNTATATIRCHTTGTAVITAEIDGLTASCTLGVSGIEEIVAGDGSSLDIYSANGNIYAPTATGIEVYTISGTKVADIDGECVERGAVSDGIYIVVATDNAGNRAVEKVIVKQ